MSKNGIRIEIKGSREARKNSLAFPMKKV